MKEKTMLAISVQRAKNYALFAVGSKVSENKCFPALSF
jgi:hypothetical protein